MEKENFSSRCKLLQQKLRQHNFAAALLLSRSSIYYYAGTGQPCNLLIPVRGEPTLFARRAVDFVLQETWLHDIREGATFEPLAEEIKRQGVQGKIGVESDVVPAALFHKLKKTLPYCELDSISSHILEQRSVKDSMEIAHIKTAGTIFSRMHETILEKLRPGLTELELAGEVLKTLRSSGGEGVVFQRRWDAALPPDGFIAAGIDNLTRISGHAMTVTGRGAGKIIPWGASPRAVQAGELLVADIAVSYQGYHIDTARTYVLGPASQEQKAVFRKVKAIQEAVLYKLKPGVTAEELWMAALEKARELEVEAYFQGYGEKKGRYIGHGTGLEFDEPPVLAPGIKKELKEGSVVSIEPKLIIPGWGAVDLEDTVLVTKNGWEFLCSVERKLFEVS